MRAVDVRAVRGHSHGPIDGPFAKPFPGPLMEPFTGLFTGRLRAVDRPFMGVYGPFTSHPEARKVQKIIFEEKLNLELEIKSASALDFKN